jgi:uncharacterized protein YlxW (UPF0749 family)
MIYLIIISIVTLVGITAIFVSNNSSHEKDININNEKLDKMFEFLRDDIVVLNVQVKELEKEIDAIKQIQFTNGKRIETLENQLNQLRTGSNSRFY